MKHISNKRRIKVGTWGISICLHLVAIVLFTRMGLSQSPKSIAINRSPRASISRVKEIITDPPAAATLPKISYASRTGVSALPELRPIQTKFEPEIKSNILAELASVETITALPEQNAASSVEFFGSKSYNRKICYVVDASGSMQGIFSGVRRNLKHSIENLQPDQYFHIIFFSAGGLKHFQPRQLFRATPKNKTAAGIFIDSITPAGTTNTIDALTAAMQLRDSLGKAPQIIYFLTDGFELTGTQISQFLNKLLALRKNLAPNVKINTIGFWTQPADCELLSKIARKTGGRFTRIRNNSNE